MSELPSAHHFPERQGPPVIVCRTITIPEAELLKFLHIDEANAAGYRLWRHLHKRDPNLTPQDVAVAVREMRPAVELWIDAVMARLIRLQPRGPQHHRRALQRHRRSLQRLHRTLRANYNIAAE